MKLRSTFLFSTLVKSGSLSAAAQEFNVTPSAVSKWLAQLEERLGVRLIARNTRRFSMTPSLSSSCASHLLTADGVTLNSWARRKGCALHQRGKEGKVGT
jgi:molybdenum-dependent DNA-binding transcriptional regulator ModE